MILGKNKTKQNRIYTLSVEENSSQILIIVHKNVFLWFLQICKDSESHSLTYKSSSIIQEVVGGWMDGQTDGRTDIRVNEGIISWADDYKDGKMDAAPQEPSVFKKSEKVERKTTIPYMPLNWKWIQVIYSILWQGWGQGVLIVYLKTIIYATEC